MRYCNHCTKYSKGTCKLKKYKVTFNANWCKDYTERFIYRLINKLK